MISGGDGAGWPQSSGCTNPQVLMANLFRQFAADETTERKGSAHWIAFSKTFQLMDDRYYTLQALLYKGGSQRPSQPHAVKLFNDRGEELERVDQYPCGDGVVGTFQRSLDVLLMEQALELATGERVPVR